MPLELRPHQQKAVDELGNGKILYGGVGSGKTIAALAYYYTKVCGGVIGDYGSLRRPMDIYVITTAKKRDHRDWEIEAAQFLISPDRDISAGGTKLHVDSWNNIAKYVDVKQAFFVFDEQRLVGSGAWVRAFKTIARNNQWILLSATPGDTWLDYVPVFVANGFYTNRTEFKREHVIYNHHAKFPKVDRYVGVSRLVRYRNDLLVHMPYDRHTVRHLKIVEVDHDTELFSQAFKDRWHVFEERPIRDIAELARVLRKIVNSDRSRLEGCRAVLERHPRLIIFYSFDYELEILRELDKNCPVAEWNGHRHDPVPVGDTWVYLVNYRAGAEGWNCITTDAMVFWSLTYSYRDFEQSQGRIDRLNTPYHDLWYYIMKSNSWIDRVIWKAMTHKENFNERKALASLG